MINRFENYLKESVIGTLSFKKIIIKNKCKKKIFDLYPNDSFIIVLNETGKVIVYDKKFKNAFNNLNEVISLFGSHFFYHPISKTELGSNLIEYYEKNTNCKIREIYKFKL